MSQSKDECQLDRSVQLRMGGLAPLLKQLAIYQHRYKSRKVLLRLTDDQLRDIGIDKDLARREGRKPFWIGEKAVFDEKVLREKPVDEKEYAYLFKA